MEARANIKKVQCDQDNENEDGEPTEAKTKIRIPAMCLDSTFTYSTELSAESLLTLTRLAVKFLG